MTPNEKILSDSLRHAISIERHKVQLINELLTIVNSDSADLVGQIAAKLSEIEERGFNVGPQTKKKLDALIDSIRAQRTASYKFLDEKLSLDLKEFAVYEAEFQAKVIEVAAASVGASIEMSRPSERRLKAIIDIDPFQGRLLNDWYAGLASADAQRISDAIKIGMVEGQTTDQIVRRIRGTRAARYTNGILEISRRDAANIVQTATAHVASRAKDELYAENAGIIDGVQWVSTLDSRTCTKCGALDGKVFSVGKAPARPLHFGPCRCQTVAYLGEFSVKGTRASQFGQVPENMVYEDWLRKQSESLQEHALGKSKAKLFRDGKLPIDRFTDTTGKEYTLAQLKQRDAEIWTEVFG